MLKASIIAILISLSTWLHDGLKSYEAKKYDDAITNLTKVIEKDVPQNRYRDVALFYRAKSYEAKKDKKKALADLLLLIQKFPASYVAKPSVALYKKLGGDMKKILPADSPTKVWEKFVAAAKAGDLKGALKISTGQWKELVITESENDPEELKREFSREEIAVGEEQIGKGEQKGTATLALTADHGQVITLEFIINKKTNSWIISGYQEMDRRRGGRRGGTSISNINNLKQIGLGCRMYSNDHNENFPPNLDALKTEGFLENEAVYLWTNPTNQKEKAPFIYAPGYTEEDDVETMIAAAPKAVNGKREVLWLDGHVKAISENEFIKNAKTQKWRLKGLLKKEEIPEKIKKKVLALISKLADKDFDIRKKAKAELIKLGDSAFPFLEENKNHKDPEVKITIKDILTGK